VDLFGRGVGGRWYKSQPVHGGVVVLLIVHPFGGRRTIPGKAGALRRTLSASKTDNKGLTSEKLEGVIQKSNVGENMNP